MGVRKNLTGGNMEKLRKNKKKIIISAVIIILVSLIASIFIDVSFAGLQIESSKVIDSCECICGYAITQPNIEQFNYIDWPERQLCFLCDDFHYLANTNYIIRISDTAIDVYNIATEEIKEIFSGNRINYSIFITENEIVFSQWEKDIKNWPVKAEANGTYKYSFKTGEIQKICNGKYQELTLINEHILIGKNYWLGIPKIIFLF